MEGRARAAKNRYEEGLSIAWHTAAFDREKRLKPLGKYLAANQPKKAQDGAEMIAALKELNARGAPMDIQRVDC